MNRGWVDRHWRPATGHDYPTLRSSLYADADAVVRLALAGYYAAVRAMRPPDGERWATEGLPYGTAESFHDALLHEIGERLRHRAIETGHLVERLADPGAGRSPAVKGQGCPASGPGALPPASAVGPATMPLQSRDITIPENPLLFAFGMQELPPGETPVNNQNLGERNHVE